VIRKQHGDSDVFALSSITAGFSTEPAKTMAGQQIRRIRSFLMGGWMVRFGKVSGKTFSIQPFCRGDAGTR
jgi:hypothetical protein